MDSTPQTDSEAPTRDDREKYVAWIAAVADDLIAGRMPAEEARLFVASGIRAWLTNGGNLTRDYWLTSARAGSHSTESQLWKKIISSSRGGR